MSKRHESKQHIFILPNYRLKKIQSISQISRKWYQMVQKILYRVLEKVDETTAESKTVRNLSDDFMFLGIFADFIFWIIISKLASKSMNLHRIIEIIIQINLSIFWQSNWKKFARAPRAPPWKQNQVTDLEMLPFVQLDFKHFFLNYPKNLFTTNC